MIRSCLRKLATMNDGAIVWRFSQQRTAQLRILLLGCASCLVLHTNHLLDAASGRFCNVHCTCLYSGTNASQKKYLKHTSMQFRQNVQIELLQRKQTTLQQDQKKDIIGLNRNISPKAATSLASNTQNLASNLPTLQPPLSSTNRRP